MDNSNVINDLCTLYTKKALYKTLISIAIAVAIILIKTILKKIVIALSKFQRYK